MGEIVPPLVLLENFRDGEKLEKHPHFSDQFDDHAGISMHSVACGGPNLSKSVRCGH